VRTPISTEEERTAFLEALEESLRPLMRVALKYGANYEDLIEVIRGLYITALRDQLDAQGRPSSISRLGLMAGMSRREMEEAVSRRSLREQQRAEANRRFDQLCVLLAKWNDDPKFSTPYGAPLDLSLQVEGNFRTFDELVNSSGTGLDRESALEGLQRNGCAEVHNRQFVRCTTRTFLPKGKDLSRITRLGRLGKAMHSNYVHNLLRDSDTPSFFERTMVSDFPISPTGALAFHAQVRADGEDFIGGLDRWLTGKQPDYEDSGGHQFGLVTFFFEDSEKLFEPSAFLPRPREATTADA
jgi:hypothetical protein